MTLSNIIALLAIIDMFFPAIMGYLSGEYYVYSYIKNFSNDEILDTVVLADLSLLFFLLGYETCPRFCIRRSYIRNNGSKYDYTLREKWLYFFYFFAIFLILWQLFYEYKSLGSFAAFYDYKIKRVYLYTVEYTGPIAKLLSVLYESAFGILLSVTSIMVSNSKRYNKRSWKLLFPMVSGLLCLTTLSRGTILSFFLCIVASLEYTGQFPYGATSKRTRERIKIYSILGVIGFCIFGAYRTNLTNQLWNNTSMSFLESLSRMITNTLGVTLIAFARCIRYVADGGSLFGGTTYIQMFLAFIPRSIMPNKPTQYGVINLTKAMGSPATTMDAVSMPGELIMNFGFCGLILMFVWGMIICGMDRLKESERGKYFLAAKITSIATTAWWMSFTGFFAQVKYFPIYIIVLCLIIRRVRIS